MVDFDSLIPDQTTVIVKGEEGVFRVIDTATDGIHHLVKLDKPCQHTVAENFIYLNHVHAIVHLKNN